MTDHKKKLLEQTYQKWVDICFSDNIPIDDVEYLVADDIMGYGTTLEEKILGVDEVKGLLKIGREQGKHLSEKKYIQNLILKRISKNGDTVIFVDEIDFTFKVAGADSHLALRISSVLEYLDESWKVTHWHDSVAVETDERDTFHLDEMRRKNQELQKLVLERTVELSEKKRELEIETVLERVRARTMAMQHSNELADTASILFEQIKRFGFETWSCGFCTWKENDTVEVWMGADSGALLPPMLIPYKKEPTHHNIYNASLTGADSHEKIWEGKALNKHYNFLRTIPSVAVAIKQLEDAGLSLPTKQCYYIGFFKQGYLLLITKEPNAEMREISKRFAKVFEQAYIRFLDLQKAEAQAREAQIEAAVERVRGKALAMQKSEDLHSVVVTLKKALMGLNIRGVTAVSMYLEQDDGSIRGLDLSSATADEEEDSAFKMDVVFRLEAIDPDLWIRRIWNGTEKYFVVEADEEDFKRIVKWLYTLDEKKAAVAERIIKEEGIKKAWLPTVKLEKGKLNIDLLEPPSQEIESILIKIGAAFDLAYKRFLDLQKAEAQAREAQIELALERVRARTMAMQKSEELHETSQILFQQMKELGESVEQLTIGIVKETENVVEIFATIQGSQLQQTFRHSIDEPKVMNKIYRGWKAQQKSLLIEMNSEEIQAYNRYRNELVKSEMFSTTVSKDERRIIYAAYFSKGMLALGSNTPLSEESHRLLERFAGVFDGTYTRFLDLQKAETQAREANIEVALERVRSKAMAMHKSEDLNAAVGFVFEELDKLNLGMSRCGIGILNKERRSANTWLTSIGDQGTTVQISGEESMDLHPLLQGTFDAWLKQEEFSYMLQGDDMREYYQTSGIGNVKLPESQLILSEGESKQQFYHLASFEAGGLFAFRETAFPEEARTVMKRFAGVFNLTYNRFLDLQKAEAQTREAKIEIALERVRSRTMAMQKSNELAETSVVVFKQLIDLGIQPNRLYIAIISDDSGDIEFWATDEDGSKISTKFTGNKNKNKSVLKMYDSWIAQEKSLTIDMKGKELESYFHYLGDVMHVPFKKGFSQKRRVQTMSFFSKGFIGIAAPEEQPESTTKLLERFASVFNLTYTRFNDLQIAEANAIQAEKDLILLQTEKKKAEDALAELQHTQNQLIQSEKMASLGELTAGIAHEIQNPLNFVNNFSEVSNELIEEMSAEIEKGDLEEAKFIMADIKSNLEKINHHGKRADAIVKGMLQHSRKSSSEKEPTDINKLADEYLRLAYHGLRAKDKDFNATLETDFDESIGKIAVIPQDLGRVILNLITNAFYACNEKKTLRQAQGDNNYEPTVTVSTKRLKDKITIAVKDNGNGISKDVLDKIFQPFFTTKPTGQGTGLGLSLSYDIIKVHGGELKVETIEGENTKFTILLPH